MNGDTCAARAVVIVGASLAGLRAAQAIRDSGFDGRLVLIGDEVHPPYQRPPLSKAVLAGDAHPDEAALAADLDVEWRLGTRATSLDPVRRVVGLDDGEVHYDRLVISTGTFARPWPSDTPLPDGVLTVRTRDDAVELRERLLGGARVVVVGAGFLGCEVAAAARGLGLPTTLCDVTETPMAVLGPQVGGAYSALHAERGADLVLGSGVAGLDGGDRLEAVRLVDGRSVPADVAVLALGAVPAVDWLEGSGLPVQDGLVCDATCTVEGFPEIVACGDVAAWPHALAGGEIVRIEHFNNASQQGRHAGEAVLLPHVERQAFDALPSFWSDQYDVNLQVLGFPRRAMRTVLVEGDVGERRFVVAGVRGEQVVSIAAVGAPARVRAYRKLLARPVTLDEVRAAVAADAKGLGST